MPKKIIIIDKPKGCRLANQLWNWISIYAFCLENNYKCENFCFFEDKKMPISNIRSYDNYYRYFDLNNLYIAKTFVRIHLFLMKIDNRTKLLNRYANFIKKRNPNSVFYSTEESFYFLPPSKNNNPEQKKELEKINNKEKNTFYFDGWQFRNPVGIKKYHPEIIKYFKPKEKTEAKIKKFIEPLRQKYKKIIGVHIRQGDYKFLFPDSFYFEEKKVMKILLDFLSYYKYNKENVLFIICSDERINLQYFANLNVIINSGNVIEDLFILSSTDLIIGTDSTFGPLAAFFGDIPFIVFENIIDWSYYKNHDKYFENFKCKNLFPY